MLSIFDYLNAVYENVFHSDRVLMRLFEGRAVSNRRRIEDRDISKHSCAEKSTVIQAQVDGGQSREAMQGFAERDHFFFADVFAQQSGKIPIGARMRI